MASRKLKIYCWWIDRDQIEPDDIIDLESFTTEAHLQTGGTKEYTSLEDFYKALDADWHHDDDYHLLFTIEE